MIKAVVFDFDGLIVDTETVWYESYHEILRKYGIAFPTEVFSRCIGTDDAEFDRFLKGMLGTTNRIRELKEEAAFLHKEKIKTVKERPGVRMFLEEAKRFGYGVGLASSSDRGWVEQFLTKLALYDYFDVIKTKDDVSRVKPDPELYRQAIEDLQVKPYEAVAFEDSVNGAKAAKAAGLWCVIVPNPVTEKLVFDQYDIRISSMEDHSLLELIREFE